MPNGHLVKAKITNLSTGKKVVCMFNPREYTFSKTNNWSENIKKGQNVAELEFGGGAPASLSLQLLFDTYESHGLAMAGEDVRKYTKGLWDMMKIDEKTKRPPSNMGHPPHCQFTWGSLWSFEAVIVSISQKFTLFASDGTPLRAILDVSFKQIKDEGQYPRQNPTSGGNPGDHMRVVREGETLVNIAYEEYGDPTVWRHLANINQLSNPLRLRPGQSLIVTPLPTL